jgi:hypothetical protein
MKYPLCLEIEGEIYPLSSFTDNSGSMQKRTDFVILSFADSTLIMFVKSSSRFAIEMYRSSQSFKKDPGIFRVQSHDLMLLDGFFGLLQGTGQYEMTDRFTLKTGSTL